jgi:hypothetical protein
MENELTLLNETTELSSNVFTDPKFFKPLYDMGKMFATSKMVPAAYQDKPMDCAIAIEMAARMNISPMMVMQNLYIVQGKPQWSGQACAALIAGSGKFKNIKPVYSGEPGTDEWGCHVEAMRTDDGETVTGTRVTIEMAKDEGWYAKSGSKWKTMPEQMLAYRAYAFFARVHIPNALMGVAVEGEVEDITKALPEKPIDPLAEVMLNVPYEVIKEADEVFA